MTKIEELRAAFEAATGGEWSIFDTYDAHLTNEYPPRVEGVTEIQSYSEGNSPCYTTSDQDAEFIALAHNNMPALLEAVECLQDVKDWLTTGKVDGVGFDQNAVIDAVSTVLEKLS